MVLLCLEVSLAGPGEESTEQQQCSTQRSASQHGSHLSCQTLLSQLLCSDTCQSRAMKFQERPRQQIQTQWLWAELLINMTSVCIPSAEFHLLASTAHSPHDAEEGEHGVPSTPVPPLYLIQATFELRQSQAAQLKSAQATNIHCFSHIL